MIHPNKPAPKCLTIQQRAELIELLFALQGGKCYKCGCNLNEYNTSPPHHALIKNHAENRKRYPFLVHHAVNQVLLCYDCHQLYPNYMQLDCHMIDIVDRFLTRNQNDGIRSLKETIYTTCKEYINWCDYQKVVPGKHGGANA